MTGAPAWADDVTTAPHRATWQVEAIPQTGPSIVLPITAGSVTVDATAYPRTVASIAVGDLSLAPQDAADVLTPFGTRLRFGYTLTDGPRTLTLAPFPDLYLAAVNVERGAAVGLTLDCEDAAGRIVEDAFLAPVDPPAGARTVSALVAYLIRRTWPGATIRDTVNSAEPVPADLTLDGSPWAIIEDLADSVGAECYVAPDNAFVFAPAPERGAPVSTLATGPGGTVTSTRSTVRRAPNRVALRFRSASGALVVGTWSDQSGSPLDVDRMGRVSLVETRDRAASKAQADAAAAAYARRVAGKVRDVAAEAVARPWLTPGQTIAVRFASGVTEYLVLIGTVFDLSGVAPAEYTFRTDTVGAA